MSREIKEENTELEDFNLEVPATAFNMDSNRAALNTRPARYNRELAFLCSAVEELDRHDDFSALRISGEKYRKSDKSP